MPRFFRFAYSCCHVSMTRGLLIAVADMQVEAKLERQLQQCLPDVQGATCLSISALTGEGVDQVLPAVLSAYSTWNQRITTHQLNKWLVQVSFDEPCRPLPSCLSSMILHDVAIHLQSAS